MPKILFEGSEVGEMAEDGALIKGNPCLVALFRSWELTGSLLRFNETSVDDPMAHGDGVEVVPITKESVSMELMMYGFVLEE